MPFFRKKPVVVEAIQSTGNNDAEILAFVGGRVGGKGLDIPDGWWLIKNSDGLITECCSPDIFDATYETEGLEKADVPYTVHFQPGASPTDKLPDNAGSR